MSEKALKITDSIQLENVADEVAKKYGRKAYDQLCEQWGIPFDEQTAKIFIAAFASGAHTGISVLLEAT